MPEFCVTFGVQYSPDPDKQEHGRETHPIWPPADGDGYVIVEAPDLEAAQMIASGLFGNRYAFVYPPPFPIGAFKMGEIGRFALVKS